MIVYNAGEYQAKLKFLDEADGLISTARLDKEAAEDGQRELISNSLANELIRSSLAAKRPKAEELGVEQSPLLVVRPELEAEIIAINEETEAESDRQTAIITGINAKVDIINSQVQAYNEYVTDRFADPVHIEETEVSNYGLIVASAMGGLLFCLCCMCISCRRKRHREI